LEDPQDLLRGRIVSCERKSNKSSWVEDQYFVRLTLLHQFSTNSPLSNVRMHPSIYPLKRIQLFLRYGGLMHKLGPPLFFILMSLLFMHTVLLSNYAADSIKCRELVKLAEFLIGEGVDLNAIDKFGTTSFWNCAWNGETGLCKLLVERGADPSVKKNDGGIALHVAAQLGSCDTFRYLVEDCGLDTNAECREYHHPRAKSTTTRYCWTLSYREQVGGKTTSLFSKGELCTFM
jgi:hypothetical protein